MAKKSKNSKLLVHYTRTMTPENLSRAANYVGEYVLKGLGALGKIMTAPLTGGPLGPATVVLPKTKELLDAERKLRETQELLIGKVMTWVSPLNYSAALMTGNGLNAKKGEEEVASWSPAWQAVGRLGELYVGPKVVKGVKAAPKTVVNTAAKAGVKPAKAAVVAREINLATKNEPNIEVPKPITRTKVGDVEIDNPNLLYHLDRGNSAGAFSNQGAYVENGVLFPGVAKKEGLLGYSWWNEGKPYATSINDQPMTRLMTATKDTPGMLLVRSQNYPIGQWTGNKGFVLPSEYVNSEGVNVSGSLYNWKPGYGYKKIAQEPSTSLKFFERKPSKISEAERLGISKGDRGNLSLNLKLAIEDLALYKNSGLYRQVFRVTPDWEDFGWNLDRNNPTFMLLFIADKETMKGPFARVLLLTPTGKGVVAWNPEKNMGGYSSRSFTTPEGMNWAPGEANMMLDGANGLKVILTAPKTDFFDSVVEESSKHLGENLSSTIDKNIMKDFWINSRKVQRPGSYMSGDNGVAPLGSTLIKAFKKKQLYKTPLLERPINLLFIRRTGLSPDSYSSIIRLGNRDGSLRWGEGFTKWNNSAVENKFINDAFEQLKKGEISPEQYEGIFNKWSLKIGGRPLQWTTIGELKIPVHPHPYIYAKKQGGKMNILEFLKKGGGIHIKEKNKGKFTSYCGGKVTDECILKGKNSSNPAIRKRATFADNARHFKHKEGGTVKALEGTKFNWGSAIGNLASNALLLGISTYMLNKKLSSDAEADKERYKSEAASKLQKDMQDERTKRFNILNAIKGTSDNPNAFGGEIFEKVFINLGDNEAIRNYNQSISDYNKMIDLQVRAQKAEGVGNFLSSLGLLGVGLLANSAFNKNSTNTSSASTSATSSTNTSYNLSNFWSTPSLSYYLSNLSVLYNPDKFWNMNPK